MAKKYADPQSYEVKLERVMERLGAEKYDYDWSRRECWVEFWYKGQLYRFSHSVENAQKHGVDIQYGSDVFAQVVLSLEDLARMVERGIYDSYMVLCQDMYDHRSYDSENGAANRVVDSILGMHVRNLL